MATKVKNELNRKNVEGACKEVEGILQLMEQKHVALEGTGMKSTYPKQLREKNEKMCACNHLQNKLMNTGIDQAYEGSEEGGEGDLIKRLKD